MVNDIILKEDNITEQKSNRPAHLWKPGQSGNPGGRPKRKPITDKLRAILEAEDSEVAHTIAKEIKDLLTDKNNKNFASVLREVLDRTEGKVTQPISGEVEVIHSIVKDYGEDS